MISEGSCDTEDWSDDADNSASHHRNKWIMHSELAMITKQTSEAD